MNQGGIENVSKLITSKEIESAMRTLLTKSPEPYDPAILSILLQILPKEMKSLTQISAPLCLYQGPWKHLNISIMDEWLKKL